MPLILGIDTGGTYTDCVVIDSTSRNICCKAKELTTQQDLAMGIASCVEKLDFNMLETIDLVCLSTTLATNALVEQRGGKVGLILIGKALEKSFPVEHVEVVQGKLDIKGHIKEDIKEEEVIKAIENFDPYIEAIAISGFASVRNPVHELQVKKLVRLKMDVPLVCAHELTSELGFEERTITAAHNASLIPMINELIDAVKSVLRKKNIKAPLMIVKGDGSLMKASLAAKRPIETILSGPAASIMGGIF